jgi:hypothetical protein
MLKNTAGHFSLLRLKFTCGDLASLIFIFHILVHSNFHVDTKNVGRSFDHGEMTSVQVKSKVLSTGFPTLTSGSFSHVEADSNAAPTLALATTIIYESGL